MPRPFASLALSLLLLFALGGCGKPSLDRLPPAELPEFNDDLQLEQVLTGAVRHLHYLNTLPGDTSFTLGTDTYPASWLRESMESFIDILKQEPSGEELARIVRENFTVYQAGGRDERPRGEMLVTGYYLPFLQGSLRKEAPYLYPLYMPPKSLIQVKDRESSKTLFKRRDTNGQLVPYWTRKEIEEEGYGAGSELVYLDDPVDAFILHVQGSGRVQLRDGSVRSVHYAASNGLDYSSIGKLLVDQGKISLAEASIPTIRDYLKKHPDEQKTILHHNMKFIFFQWAEDGDPQGSLAVPLVAGRSIAVDPDVLPQQALAFLISRRPLLAENGSIRKWVDMQRFVFPQDSGSAIKGSGRVDLYWGGGDYARQAAGNMKEKGELYFLVKNNFEEHEE